MTFSALFHIILFMVFAKAMPVNLKQNRPKLVVNFNLISEPAAKPVAETAQSVQQSTSTTAVINTLHNIVKPIEKITVKKKAEKVVRTKDTAAPERVSPQEITSYADIEQSAAPTADSRQTAPTEQAEGNTQSVEKASSGQKYITENFSYIRNMVMKKISYPFSAKKMGIHGRVTVSFVVTDSGCVEELKVVESSGHGILDDSAVEAVKQAEPFPKPMAAVKIILPITYRLENG